MTTDQLHAEYEKLKSQADVLAGELLDIPRRASILTNIYLDSGRNHCFSQMAAHGALWAINYFEAGGTLGRLIGYRYFYSRSEHAFRMGILREFAESFRRVNRLVCIDTYTNYFFTQRFGERPGVEEIVEPRLLDALNRVHHAKRNGLSLTREEKRNVFEQSFHCEQEITVAPGVAKAVEEFECRIMRALCLRPIVRFSFFPRLRYLWFRDFSNKDERINKGMLSYELAANAGWDKVFEAMKYYGQMPPAFFKDPEVHFHELKAETIRRGQIAQSLAEESSAEGSSAEESPAEGSSS